MNLPFTKIETIGNHFALVEEGLVSGSNLSETAETVCRSRFGVGADGLLVVGRTDDGLRLRMFNADGSEDFCGNGMRCSVYWANRKGWVGSATKILHGGREVEALVGLDGSVEIQLPAAVFEPALVPVKATSEFQQISLLGVQGYAVSTGSTHFVVPIESEPDSSHFNSVSPRIEISPLFPERTSVMWTWVKSPGKLCVRIWERGVGETFGCGTGAVAAAVVHSRLTGSTNEIDVESRGGVAKVTIEHWSQPVKSSTFPRIAYVGTMSLPTPRSFASQQGSLH